MPWRKPGDCCPYQTAKVVIAVNSRLYKLRGRSHAAAALFVLYKVCLYRCVEGIHLTQGVDKLTTGDAFPISMCFAHPS